VPGAGLSVTKGGEICGPGYTPFALGWLQLPPLLPTHRLLRASLLIGTHAGDPFPFRWNLTSSQSIKTFNNTSI
jgi:hypothetical protein